VGARDGGESEIRQRFESILAGVRQPARYIGEEPGAGPGFAVAEPGATRQLRVVVAFPDTYEIGISNQALQILYHLAREMASVGVERTYLPWVDVIDAMRREAVPLLTIETWTPVASADVLGITLQHEFDYTNILELLDLAGLPVRAAERAEDAPLVIGGGPGCADFVPLEPFFDAFVVGDGEVVLPEVLEVALEAKRAGVPRAELKQRLSTVEGVYVPGISLGVTRRISSRLQGAPYPASCLVPLTAGVHDRAWIEVMRGCTRGCRFCQAGMWYRPVRERSADEVMRMAAQQLTTSGHQELAFASLSTTDYSHLRQVLEGMAEQHPEVRVSLPSLRVDSAAVRLAHLVSPTGPSLTLAPEAGSERMWGIVNKNVCEHDVMAAVEEAFRTGRTTLKLYFMIGFPLEEDADVEGIADLCLKIREKGREMLGDRRNRLQLNISVNNFIPKSFTPFQWTGMADRVTLRRRQELLRERLRRPGIRLALHGVDRSYLEAALARGGSEMAAIIEEAWRAGARFDNWTEEFSNAAWIRAFEAAGTTAEQVATTSYPRETALPWDIVSGVVDRDFLWTEWEKAQTGEATPDCRWDACSECGACDGAAAAKGGALVAALPGGAGGPGGSTPSMECAQASAGEATPAPSTDGPRWRYVATFSVTGRGRFIGHLDRSEILRRALRRAGGRLALSGGMRPKPLLSLGLPLAVGVEGLRELCDFVLSEPAPPELFERLARALPAHMKLLALEPYEHVKSVAARVVGALYEVRVRASLQDVASTEDGVSDDQLCAVLADAARRFAAATELPVQETRESVVRTVDVRRYVEEVSVTTGAGGTCTLSYRVAVTPSGSARPERVADALAGLAGVRLHLESITRLELLLV
jgi:radical SAM-linked protein